MLIALRMRGVTNEAWVPPIRIVARALSAAQCRRERILALLAFVMLIVAWDATLRLDERVAPPRMRMSHAATVRGERWSADGAEQKL
jgi:hypothetical protein